MLVSAGGKLIAMAAAARNAEFNEATQGEEQDGFRSGRGRADVITMIRRVIEEGWEVEGNRIWLRLFDIKKVYPSVDGELLWKIMEIGGILRGMIGVYRPVHGGTSYTVRAAGGASGAIGADRGVREGRSSSPALFSLNWGVAMEQFRARMEARAKEMGGTPGIRWREGVKGRAAYEWVGSRHGARWGRK